MSEPFIGEIRPFACGYAPHGWAECNGQLLPISTNQALFAILGTQYGGNGQTNFALPDLRGRVALGVSATIPQARMGGAETHALTQAEIPMHRHTVTASSATADKATIAGNFWASTTNYADAPDTAMATGAIATAGASQPHNNMQPYQTLVFCIAINGIFPSRQ